MNFTQRLANTQPVLVRECRGYFGQDGKKVCQADIDDLVQQVCEELLVREARGSGFDSVYGMSPEQYILAYFRRRAKERFKARKVDYVSSMGNRDDETVAASEIAYNNAAHFDDYEISSASEIVKGCADLCKDAGLEFKMLVACIERMHDYDLSAVGSAFAPLRAYARNHAEVISTIEEFIGLFSLPGFNVRDYAEA